MVHQDAHLAQLFLGVASLLITCCRELAASKIKDEVDAENFVSHAIKQKFAAVGAFVEQLSAELKANNANEATCQELANVLRDCRIGHDRCHASNLSRFIDSGRQNRTGKWKYGELKRHMAELNFAKDFISNTLLFETDLTRFAPDVAISMDWEVFDLCMSEWTRGGGGKLIKLTTARVEDGQGKSTRIGPGLDPSHFLSGVG